MELARRLNLTPATVNQWVQGSRPVPPERCRAIEDATRGAVTRYDLRPDIFGPPPADEDRRERMPEQDAQPASSALAAVEVTNV